MSYELFGHMAFLMVAISLTVKDILLLRVISIVASLSSITYNYFVPAFPLWLVINWNLVFILINTVRIGHLVHEKVTVSFSEKEKELYETLFRNFSPVEFMKILRISEWKSANKNETLTTQGQPVNNLMLVYNGAAKVIKDGQEVALLKDGDFIGEMSFNSNNPANATVIAVESVQILSWPKEELKKLLNRNPSMKFATQSVLSANLVQKLQRQT
jgi:hypothetical protein